LKPPGKENGVTDHEDALGDLIEACSARPSDALFRSLVRTARETAENSRAVEYLTAHAAEASTLAPATQGLVSRFLLEMGAAKAAIKWAQSNDPLAAIERVRALIAEGSLSDAVALYRPLLQTNPELRDARIDQRLAAGAAQTRGATVVDLRGRPIDAPEAPPAFAPLATRERITFADVGGLDDVKAQISRKIILPFQKPGVFQRFRKRSGGGVLMYGPPGCGKTMLARATAGECGAAFINVEIPDVLDMYIGESEKRLAAIFAEARQKAPAVLFFDEIEAIAARRRFGETSTGAAVVSTFLAEMDGFSSVNEGVLILAATNVPWAIDSAFRRHGRFDRFLFVPPPDRAARVDILKKQMTDRPQDEHLDIERIASRTAGFSGADLLSLVEEATDQAIDASLAGDIAPISDAHFSESLKSVKATTIDWLTSARNYAKYANQGGLYDDVIAFLESHAER
jgi:AAA+ superfamily predicted ATPase